jgi:hypothetical protein
MHSAIRERVAKMLGMLGSASEGERLAAVAAIDRTIKGAGMSWGEFAQEMADAGAAGTPQVVVLRRVIYRDRPGGRDGIPVDYDRVKHLADCILRSTNLNKSERRFIAQMRAGAEIGVLQMAPAQVSWFANLYQRYGSYYDGKAD